MFSKQFSRFALGLLACAAIGAFACAKDPKEFVVHEWGTFSTFSGADGKYLKFYPDDSGLPDFVYNRHRNVKGGLPDAFVSMETPVMYFYSDRDRSVSVQVDFPKGMMTDWYPQASRAPTESIRWDNFKVLAGGKGRMVDEGGGSRYYAARETDAALVQVTAKDKIQNEKFLFYRGVADILLPFTVRAEGRGMFAIKNTGRDEIPAAFLIRVDGKKVYFKNIGTLSPRDEKRVQESIEESTAEKLGEEVARALVEQGLYDKEARAMVKTWSADWFGQDGTRVIYLVPESQTTELLPARIEPKPDKLVRVLVGRHDLLTPEKEREVEGLVRHLNGSSNAQADAASDALSKMLGRYRWAAQTAAANRLKQSRR